MTSSNQMDTNADRLGFDPAMLELLKERVCGDIDAGKYDGARILAARRGTIVLDLTTGFRSREAGQALVPEAAFNVMSISKVMTAVAALRCIERGQLSLLTPISQIIPEFSARGKSLVTVGQILTHTAGLGMAPAPIDVEDLGNLEKCTAAICELALESAPGELVSYSASTGFTILGEIVRRLDSSGRAFQQIMDEDIFQPLGMQDTAFGLPPNLSSRRVPVIIRDDDAPELNHQFLTKRDALIGERTELPSGGGAFSTASDMMRFAEMLRSGGALHGARILSPATVEMMRTNQTGLRPNSMFNSSRSLHGMAPFPAFLGMGLFLRGEGIFPSHMPTLASPSTFGGWGLGSVCFWVDPVREISFVALTSGLMERIRSLLRFQALGDTFIASLINPQC